MRVKSKLGVLSVEPTAFDITTKTPTLIHEGVTFKQAREDVLAEQHFLRRGVPVNEPARPQER